MRLALFGGSFNPPHLGHQMAMLHVLATARVDRLWMVPCWRHPFEKALAPFEHRLAMSRLAAAPFGGRVEVSDVEARMGGESRTLHTVRRVLDEVPGARVSLVIGSDLLDERERWFGWAELARLVEFVVLRRGGHEAGTAGAALTIPEVSSSGVRERLARGEAVDGLVPADVVDYIRAQGLYGR